MPVTQADVARRAGVSQRTVSNVVNRLPSVKPEVVTRVTAAIKELGYTPSQAARSLRLGRSGVLQLVVPELDVPYFAELARGIIKAAEDRGYGVMVRQTLGSRDREQEALDGSAADYAEGTILSAVAPIEEVLPVGGTRSPVVLIGERSGNGLVDHIGIDDVAAAAEATRHLIRSGRRRIAFVGAHPDASLRMAAMRFQGYREAIEEAGLRIEDDLVVRIGSYHRADGEAAMNALLSLAEPPDGAFFATDLLALGGLRAAYERAIRVPDQMAVIGFDGLEEGRFSAPALSTIEPDKQELARASIEMLLSRIQAREGSGDEPEKQDILIPFRLVARESS